MNNERSGDGDRCTIPHTEPSELNAQNAAQLAAFRALAHSIATDESVKKFEAALAALMTRRVAPPDADTQEH